MEIALNLAWLVLSASLSFIWISGPRLDIASGMRPSRKVQLLALAMLIVILLPVISMTDDVQTMSAAEIEHVIRRVDSDQPVNIPAPAEAPLLITSSVFSLPLFARLELPAEDARPRPGTMRQMVTRPPPPPTA